MQIRLARRKQCASIRMALLLLLSCVVFIGAVWWLIHERNPDIDVSGLQSEQPSTPQTRQLAQEMDELNNMLRQARERWKSGDSRESVLEKLEAIKVRLFHIKNDSAPALQEQYSELTKRIDDIMMGIRERMDSIGDLFDDLMNGIQDVRRNVINSTSHTVSSSDEEEEYEARQHYE